MLKKKLGNTTLEVSKICFGSLTMGPLQRNFAPAKGADLIRYAFEKGVNFIDTAELYETYPHIREALRHIPRESLVVASKCYAYSKETAEQSLEQALREMNTDYVDLFMLHEQVDVHTIRGHYEAIEYFLKAKSEGKIKAFGISTHYVSGVEAGIRYPEIEVVHPIINVNGLGIQDGGRDDMVAALKAYKARGGGVFAMKPFGGGNLLSSIDACFDFILDQPYIDAIAFGMQSYDEIDYNVARVNGDPIDPALAARLSKTTKTLNIADWCIACGACIEKCDHGALTLVDGQAVVDRKRCVLCGYCAAVCPELCIKVY
ncbi:aldo/keto reductase [Fusibacter sp. JL298sf-3]